LLGTCALVLPQAADSRAAENRADEMAVIPAVGLFDGIEHVYYRDAKGDILAYHCGADKVWSRTDLTAAASAPKAASNPTAYFVTGEKIAHVVYRGTDNQIHELYHAREPGKWFHTNLSTAANAPKAAGCPSGYAGPDNTQHVFFRTEDGSVNELYFSQEGGAKGWQSRNITGEANAPKAASDPGAYMLPASWLKFWKDRDRQHVVYRGTDDQIHELFFSTSQKKWQTVNLSSATEAPKAAGNPMGYFLESGNTQHVVFRTQAGDVCELFYKIDAPDAKWHLKDLTQEAGAPKAAGEPIAYTRSDDRSEYVLYRSADGQIQELFFSPKQTKWAHHNLSEATKAPKAQGTPAANLTEKPLTQHVYFVSMDNKLCELFRDTVGKDQNWHLNNLTDNVEKR
jgi:catechol 2,3-dioxygenase-like lactoylglutathione lyase family enzyme